MVLNRQESNRPLAEVVTRNDLFTPSFSVRFYQIRAIDYEEERGIAIPSRKLSNQECY